MKNQDNNSSPKSVSFALSVTYITASENNLPQSSLFISYSEYLNRIGSDSDFKNSNFLGENKSIGE